MHGTTIQQANTWFSLADLAQHRSDHDGARAEYERALPLYQQIEDTAGEARCIEGLGDIALDRSDLDGARAQFERALALYQAIPEPYSIGSVLLRLAILAPPGEVRTRRWAAAREAWASIGRDDLIENHKDEFEPQHQRRKKGPRR